MHFFSLSKKTKTNKKTKQNKKKTKQKNKQNPLLLRLFFVLIKIIPSNLLCIVNFVAFSWIENTHTHTFRQTDKHENNYNESHSLNCTLLLILGYAPYIYIRLKNLWD